MMSLVGASRTVVAALLLPGWPAGPRPGAALGKGAGASAAAPPAGSASLPAPDIAEATGLLPEHPASNSAPPSMVPTTTSPATPNRVCLVRADRPFKLPDLSMPL
jgi:hypothetical protein